jgi:hypothetical protein
MSGGNSASDTKIRHVTDRVKAATDGRVRFQDENCEPTGGIAKLHPLGVMV